jgi:hypothetical protein
MTNVQPPRLAVALLNRFLPENEPLVGDLLEEFAVRRSRLWLWRQVACALRMGAFQSRVEVRPLRLVDRSPVEIMRPWARRRTFNLSASPLPGVGGLSVVILVTLMTTVSPQIWWVVLLTVLAGLVFGLALVLMRRQMGLRTTAGDRGSLLHLVGP